MSVRISSTEANYTSTGGTVRYSRVIVEETLKWAHQRLVFGKRLIDQPVIRLKLAKMIALVEAHQSWLETITYQMCNMPYSQQSKHLGGPIGLLKMSCTRMAHEIADESVQIWGGRGLTQSGMGRTVSTILLLLWIPVFHVFKYSKMQQFRLRSR